MHKGNTSDTGYLKLMKKGTIRLLWIRFTNLMKRSRLVKARKINAMLTSVRLIVCLISLLQL
jgi:hypothetical protein